MNYKEKLLVISEKDFDKLTHTEQKFLQNIYDIVNEKKRESPKKSLARCVICYPCTKSIYNLVKIMK